MGLYVTSNNALKAKMLGEAPQRQVIGMIAFFFFLPSKVTLNLEESKQSKGIP